MAATTLSRTASASFELWGGRADVAVTDPAALPEALALVQRTVAEFDRACSSFRTDSELVALNAARGVPLAVSATLFEAVAVAVRAARLTDGDVDPTVGLALIAHRLLPVPPHMAGNGEALGPISFEPVPGHHAVTLDDTARTIAIAGGVRLDLGATAKALAADRAAADAAQAVGCGVIVNLLGDLSTAGEAPVGGWPVRVTDDHRAGFDAPGQTVAVREGGLATSSTTVRRTPDGHGHHVIDPRTGAPATVLYRTVSVAASSCVDANIATTAAIVRGLDAPAWLSALGLAARLVHADGAVTVLCGWPDEAEQPS